MAEVNGAAAGAGGSIDTTVASPTKKQAKALAKEFTDKASVVNALFIKKQELEVANAEIAKLRKLTADLNQKVKSGRNTPPPADASATGGRASPPPADASAKEELTKKLQEVEAERDAFQQRLTTLEKQTDGLRAATDSAVARERLTMERENSLKQDLTVAAERHTALAEKHLQAKTEAATAIARALEKENLLATATRELNIEKEKATKLNEEVNRLREVEAQLNARAHRITQQKNDLETQHMSFTRAHEDCAQKFSKASENQREIEVLQKNMEQLAGQRNHLQTSLGELAKQIQAQAKTLAEKESTLQRVQQELHEKTALLQNDNRGLAFRKIEHKSHSEMALFLTLSLLVCSFGALQCFSVIKSMELCYAYTMTGVGGIGTIYCLTSLSRV